MDREAGGLIQHQGEKVLIDRPHRDGGVGQAAFALLFGQGKGDGLPRKDPLIGQDGRAVRRKAAAAEFDRPQKVGGKAALPQKTAQQHPFGPGRRRHRKVKTHPFHLALQRWLQYIRKRDGLQIGVNYGIMKRGKRVEHTAAGRPGPL